MRRRRNHYRPMGALGEPITLGTAALWAIGGFVLAKVMRKDRLTPQLVQDAQVLRSVLQESQLFRTAILTDEDVARLYEKNPELLEEYKIVYERDAAGNVVFMTNDSGVSVPVIKERIRLGTKSVAQAAADARYAVAIADAQQKAIAPVLRVLSGIPLYSRNFGAVGRR